MKRCLLLLVILMAAAVSPVMAQFTAEELAQREAVEEFLASAEIVESEPMGESESATAAWRLVLRGGGVEAKALWTNITGMTGSFLERWRCEIAAYRMDKHLGVNALAPAVERRFRNKNGVMVLWVDHWISDRERQVEEIAVPEARIGHWNERKALQRAFDNLIGNGNRHPGNVLVTKDWRVILIDHTRAFGSTGQFTWKLQYGVGRPMKRLPRTFVEKVRALGESKLREIVGDTLKDDEVAAILARRTLLIEAFEQQGTHLYDR